MQYLLHVLSRMSTAVFVLVFLAFASIAGTLFEQNLPLENYENLVGPFWTSFFDVLGVFNIFFAPWFLVALLFLVVSVVSCLCINGSQIFKQAFFPKQALQHTALKRMPFSMLVDNEAEDIIKQLKQLNFSQKKYDENTVCLQKGAFNRLAYFAVHIGVVVLAFAGLISGVFGFRASVNLPTMGQSDYGVIYKGDNEIKQNFPFTIRNKGFEVTYFDNGVAKHFSSELLLLDKKGNILKQGVTEVNKPLRYQNHSLYQASFGDAGSKIKFDVISLKQNIYSLNNVDGAVDEAFKHNETGYKIEFIESRTHNAAQDFLNGITQTSNEGASLDYIVRGADFTPVQLRSYLNYGNVIGVGDGQGNYTPVFIGLSVKNPQGWEIVPRFIDALQAYVNTQGMPSDDVKLQIFKKIATPLLQKYTPEKRINIALNAMQAGSVLAKLQVPFIVNLQTVNPSYYTSLQVAYDPGSLWFWLASLLLVLGTMGMVYVSHTRVWVVKQNGITLVAAKNTRKNYKDLENIIAHDKTH